MAKSESFYVFFRFFRYFSFLAVLAIVMVKYHPENASRNLNHSHSHAHGSHDHQIDQYKAKAFSQHDDEFLNPPMPGDDSIRIAMEKFNITLPQGTEYPTFDANLADRGVTIKSYLKSTTEVRIGSSAFVSWAILGSTLAHEIEIHCQQNFFFISLLDKISGGEAGTKHAEREAYMHEINNANRFGLSIDDAYMIRDTMNFYYPKADLKKVKKVDDTRDIMQRFKFRLASALQKYSSAN